MEWTTLDRLREEHGYAAARFVRHFKNGEPIAGGIVESEMIAGERKWRLVPVDGEAPSDDEPTGDGLPLDEAPIHGRTLGALADHGLLYTGGVVELLGLIADRDTAIARLTGLKGVGKKGAGELVDWMVEHGLEFSGPVERAQQREGETPDKSPRSDAAEPPLDDDCTSGESTGPVGAAGQSGQIFFSDLEIGDEFEFERKGEVRRYRKVEPFYDDPDETKPRNALWLDQDDAPAYFRDECRISFERCELDLPDDVRTRDELRAHCADIAGQVSVVWTPDLDVDSYRKGYTVNVATRHLDGSWTWARELDELPRDLDFAMEPCSTCGQHHDKGDACEAPQPKPTAEQKRDADRARRPCNCVEPGIPDEASGWTRCTNRCGGYVWVEPERNATDGELVHVEHELADRGEWPDEEPAEAEQEAATEAQEPAPAGTELLWPDEDPDLAWPDEEVHVDATPPAAAFDASEAPHPWLPACRSVGHAATDSERWHELRSRGIGSSDAGAIIGVSPHATAADVWLSKLGEPERARPWLDAYSAFGSWFEPYLLEHCAQMSGADIRPGAVLGTLRSQQWPVAQTNLDGLDVTFGPIEELKTSSEKWTTIPESFIAQVQHQMFVTGANEARIRQHICPIDRDLAMSLLEHMRGRIVDAIADADRLLADWLLQEGEVVTWIVERDECYIERLIAREKEFWAHVENETEPPELDPDGTVDLTPDADVYAAVYEYARRASDFDAYKPLEKAKDAAKKEARREIERAVALLDDVPKRVTVGEHKATLVVRETHSYWNIYHDGEADDGVIF